MVSGWTLGLSLIGLRPWWHAGLYTLGMALLLVAWLARNRLAVQAVLFWPASPRRPCWPACAVRRRWCSASACCCRWPSCFWSYC